MRLFRHPLFLALLAFYLILASGALAQDLNDPDISHPGLWMEARYSEAVIAFNKRQTQKSIEILNELLLKDPINRAYLEMKALALKETNDPNQSLQVYLKLFALAKNEEKGPYAFEIGTLLQNQKKLTESKPYFEKAIELHFNEIASHFYLGLGAFQSESFSEAEKHFESVSKSALTPYNLIASYYLAICYFKLGNGTLGVQQLVQVQAHESPNEVNETTKPIFNSVEQILVPFSKSQWFGNAILEAQYDSNVQQLPSGVANSTGGTNPASMKMNFSGGGGYMTAPLNQVQFITAYRASYNYNFNSSTKAYEYFTNNLSFFANVHSLSSIAYGLRADASFTFQNTAINASDPNSSYQFEKYNFTPGGGLYYHQQINSHWRFEADAGITSQNFYLDSYLGGTKYTAKASVKNDRRDPYLNLGGDLYYENDQTESNDYYTFSYGAGILNIMYFKNALTLSESFDFLYTNYPKASLYRNDHNYAFKIRGVKILNPKLSLLADLGYVSNVSLLADTYSYQELISSFGIGYTF